MAYAFENMKAWQEARKLVVEVYRLLDSFPKFENYAEGEGYGFLSFLVILMLFKQINGFENVRIGLAL